MGLSDSNSALKRNSATPLRSGKLRTIDLPSIRRTLTPLSTPQRLEHPGVNSITLIGAASSISSPYWC